MAFTVSNLRTDRSGGDRRGKQEPNGANPTDAALFGPTDRPRATFAMKDLTSSTAIWTKGVLFLFLGVAAGAIVLLETRSLRSAVLLAITVWAFCRAYYFAFYVIGHYVDPGYRFCGLGSFVAYAFRRRGGRS
jgi:hypothetical protein